MSQRGRAKGAPRLRHAGASRMSRRALHQEAIGAQSTGAPLIRATVAGEGPRVACRQAGVTFTGRRAAISGPIDTPGLIAQVNAPMADPPDLGPGSTPPFNCPKELIVAKPEIGTKRLCS